MRERFGSLLGARRRDSGGTDDSIHVRRVPRLTTFLPDQLALGPPRKHSVSGLQQPLTSPRDAAPPPPRGRNGTGFDGVLGSGETWNMRRRGSETRARIGGSAVRDSSGASGQVDEISEMKLRDGADGVREFDRTDKPTILDEATMTQSPPQQRHLSEVPLATMPRTEASATTPPNVSGRTDLGSIEWSYLDTQGIVQGEWPTSPSEPGF